MSGIVRDWGYPKNTKLIHISGNSASFTIGRIYTIKLSENHGLVLTSDSVGEQVISFGSGSSVRFAPDCKILRAMYLEEE